MIKGMLVICEMMFKLHIGVLDGMKENDLVSESVEHHCNNSRIEFIMNNLQTTCLI